MLRPIMATSDASLDKLLEHIRDVAAIMQARLNILSPALQLDPELCLETALQGGSYASDFLRGVNPHILHPETIETAFDLFEDIFIFDNPNVATFGGVGSGKTTCLHFFSLIAGPLADLLGMERPCVISVNCGPSYTVDHSTAIYKSLHHLYGALRIVCNGRSHTLARYQRGVTDRLFGYGRKRLLVNLQTMQQINEIATAASTNFKLICVADDLDNIPIYRKPEEIALPKVALIDDDIEIEIEVERLFDEAEEPEDENVSDGSSVITLDDLERRFANIAGFTAAPERVSYAWKLKPMQVSDKYGSTHVWLRGVSIARKQVDMIGFTEFFERSQIDLRLLTPARFRSDQLHCFSKLLSAIDHCLTHDAARRGNGVFVRFERSLEALHNFAAFMAAHSSRKVVVYDGKFDPKINELITHYSLIGQQFVVLTGSGRSRTARDLPPEVGYFIDMTSFISKAVTLRAICGAAAGYRGEPLVIMSDVNRENVAADDQAHRHYQKIGVIRTFRRNPYFDETRNTPLEHALWGDRHTWTGMVDPEFDFEDDINFLCSGAIEGRTIHSYRVDDIARSRNEKPDEPPLSPGSKMADDREADSPMAWNDPDDLRIVAAIAQSAAAQRAYETRRLHSLWRLQRLGLSTVSLSSIVWPKKAVAKIVPPVTKPAVIIQAEIIPTSVPEIVLPSPVIIPEPRLPVAMPPEPLLPQLAELLALFKRVVWFKGTMFSCAAACKVELSTVREWWAFAGRPMAWGSNSLYFSAIDERTIEYLAKNYLVKKP